MVPEPRAACWPVLPKGQEQVGALSASGEPRRGWGLSAWGEYIVYFIGASQGCQGEPWKRRSMFY